MMRPALLAACLIVGAAAAPALFPQAAGPLEPDLSTTLHVPDARRLALDFVRFKPVPGVSDAALPYLCGVVLRLSGKPPQALVTVGTGRTTYSACDGISEDGVAKTKSGWVVALVYNISTPGGVSTAAVTLVPDASGVFHLDDSLAGRPDLATLSDLRSALAKD